MERFHRNFLDAEAEQAGNQQDFRIESPTLNLLHGEGPLGGFAAKCFKTALSIFEMQSQEHADHRAECQAANPPIKRRFDALQPLV